MTLTYPNIATAEICDIVSVINQVAALADPPVTTRQLLTGCGADNRYHIARLRGICGIILNRHGLTKARIAEAFRQDRNTTHNQILTAATLTTHERYARYFTGPAGTPLIVPTDTSNPVSPPCPKCGKPLIYVTASDFTGYSCMSTALCVHRESVNKGEAQP